MKILIVKNKYKKPVKFDKGIAHLEKNTPLKYEVEELETDFDFTFRKVSNHKFGKAGNVGVVGGDYYDKLRTVVPEGKYDIVCLVYGNKNPLIRVSIAEDMPLYPNTDVIQVVKLTDGGKIFNHEIFHVFFHKLERWGIHLPDPMDTYRNNDNLDSLDSNRTDALKLLAPHWGKFEKKSLLDKIMTAITPKPTYLYFTEKEVVGLKPELVKMLDNARGIAGTPFKINSGFRSEAQNKKVGGVNDSAHTHGEAVDIACTTDGTRWKIVDALLKVGFKRIGISSTFVHCDLDTSKGQNVIWLYD